MATPQEIVRWSAHRSVPAAIAASALAVVVLGRFARLNSWEAFTAPRSVLDEVAVLAASGRLVAVSLFFGLLVLTVYLALGAPAREGFR